MDKTIKIENIGWNGLEYFMAFYFFKTIFKRGNQNNNTVSRAGMVFFTVSLGTTCTETCRTDFPYKQSSKICKC